MTRPPKFDELPADTRKRIAEQYGVKTDARVVLDGRQHATRARGPRRHLEHDEQVEFFRRVDDDPHLRVLPVYAVPNGGHRSPAVAGKLKAEGVRVLTRTMKRLGSHARGAADQVRDRTRSVRRRVFEIVQRAPLGQPVQ